MIVWKLHILNSGMSPVDETSNCKIITFVDRPLPRNWVDYGSGDDKRVDDSEVEIGTICLHEIPGFTLGLDFGDIVTQHRVVTVDGLLCSYLEFHKQGNCRFQFETNWIPAFLSIWVAFSTHVFEGIEYGDTAAQKDNAFERASTVLVSAFQDLRRSASANQRLHHGCAHSSYSPLNCGIYQIPLKILKVKLEWRCRMDNIIKESFGLKQGAEWFL